MSTQQLNTAEITRRARAMTDEALRYARKDANEAADAADALERAGCRVSKSGGYYRDEACVYAAELRRREARS
jgi:uncharacterized membrane protein